MSLDMPRPPSPSLTLILGEAAERRVSLVSTVDTPTLLQMETGDPKGHLWPVPTSAGLFLPDGQTDGRTEVPLSV